MIESLLRKWDGETVVVRYDRPTGAWIFIAVHSSLLGPATGGTRMKPYPGIEDALRDALKLARGMTYKFAVPSIPYGGGKAVIDVPPSLDPESRRGLLRRYGDLIHKLKGLFYTGPDVGTSSADMDVIAETGAPYIFSRSPSAGGGGSPGPYTALGVFSGIQVACEKLFGSAALGGRRVLVQGAGSVGGALIEYLLKAGAEVMFSELDESASRHFRDESGLKLVSDEAVYSTDCDIFAPCALGGIISADSISRLKCKAIVGAANNQLTDPEDANRLQAKGILYAPDYVVNIGGAMAILGIETKGWSPDQAGDEISKSVRKALLEVFELAKKEGITTDSAAKRIAEKNLSKAK